MRLPIILGTNLIRHLYTACVSYNIYTYTNAYLSFVDKCELQILIDIMEFVFSGNRKLFAQSVRASFHDAGTFDQIIPEGG